MGSSEVESEADVFHDFSRCRLSIAAAMVRLRGLGYTEREARRMLKEWLEGFEREEGLDE